jgi:hypothetical protein
MADGLVQEMTQVFQLSQPVCGSERSAHTLADRLLEQFA